MGGRQHFNLSASELQHLTDFKGLQKQGGRVKARQASEVWPDHAVEDVDFERGQGLWQGMDGDGPGLACQTLTHDAVRQQANGQDMVEV
jgi:hypothetical protein